MDPSEDFTEHFTGVFSSESSDSVVETESLGGFQTLNEKKRIKRQKRKLRETPNKEEFLVKKPNLVDGMAYRINYKLEDDRY